MRRLISALLGVGLALGGWAVMSPYKGFTAPVSLDITRGTGTRAIAQQLENRGVIRYAWQFLLARVLQPSAKLQAGQYDFTEPASVFEIFQKFEKGDVHFEELTIKEGSNVFDIAEQLENQGVAKAQEFLKLAGDPGFIADLAPSAKTLEGYLFPSTYRITKDTTAEQLVKQMTGEFRKQWQILTAGAKPDPQATVTLASLVEKETGVPEERPLIASVFTNRLSKGMMLQCDPTTIYAALLDNRYKGKLYRSDLNNANPYNTYKNTGLPPGPIANPGAAALKAALHPAESDFLFFVAKPEGGTHHFSAKVGEHERAVAEYRRAQATQNAKDKP